MGYKGICVVCESWLSTQCINILRKRNTITTNSCLNHTTNVVLTLMAPLANKGYDLFTDRYYTSPQLARKFLEIGTNITGTVMVSKRGMPAAIKTKYKRKEGDVGTYANEVLVVMQSADKRTLTTLSTRYGNEMVFIPPRYEK